MAKNLRIVFMKFSGADFLCIPCKTIDDKQCYKLCFVKNVRDYISDLTVDYHVICFVESISEAKEKAKCFLENYSI